jgi:hypothetical protein
VVSSSHAFPSSVLASLPPLHIQGGGHATDVQQMLLLLLLLLLMLPQPSERNQGW